MAEKPLVWVHGEVKSPPFSKLARLEAGFLLRRLQMGETLGLPSSRPLPLIGERVHELRINDSNQTWRLVYKIFPDAIVIAAVLSKKSQALPKPIIDVCIRRFKEYENA